MTATLTLSLFHVVPLPLYLLFMTDTLTLDPLLRLSATRASPVYDRYTYFVSLSRSPDPAPLIKSCYTHSVLLMSSH